MGFRNKLHRAQQIIRERVERALGHETARKLDGIRDEILELLKSKIRVESQGKTFPFGKVKVLLQAPTQSLSSALETTFLENGSLKADMIRSLEAEKVRCPDGFEISIECRRDEGPAQTGSEPLPYYKILFLKPDPVRKSEIPAISLFITKGTAENPIYRMKKERILIGCLPEVLDREGRMVRKNDVIFPHHGGDINKTVDGAHARIWFEFEKRQFRIMDEGSRYGTRIDRQRRSIEVPTGNPRGLRLRSGDEIHCGQAGLRFELLSETDSQ